jgi:hypothetical protein
MIGRHFLVYSKDLKTVKRQYTICCSIEPVRYAQLLSVSSCFLKGEKTSLNSELFDTRDQASIMISLKDYYTINGVATRLNKQPYDGKQWYVKGPMGMGLDVQT